jgi:dimethylamine/trimethylamine dehydrogenase
MGAAHVVIATGATWRRDGVGRAHSEPIAGFAGAAVYTPDDVMAGAEIRGPVVVYDDDHYYMAGVLAEKLRRDGLAVSLVTPAGEGPSSWTHNTMEFERIQARLLELDIAIHAGRKLVAFDGAEVEAACIYTGRPITIACASVVTVTARLPADDLYRALRADAESRRAAGIKSVTAIGDALAPATIAHAVYAGHRYARELDAPLSNEVVLFRRELGLIG